LQVLKYTEVKVHMGKFVMAMAIFLLCEIKK
jgi:hypothetical protein